MLVLSCVGAEEPLTTAGAVRELLPAQAAEKRPVKLAGVVTYFRSKKLPDFVLQDATGGVHVHQPDNAGTLVEPGDEVELEGVTDAAVYAPRVDAKVVRRTGRAPVPLPIPVSVEEIQAGYHEGWLVEVSAVVRAARIDPTIDPPRLVLTLATPAGAVEAMVTRFGDGDLDRYGDAAVKVRGISLRQANRRNEPYRWLLFVHSVEDIIVTRPPPSDPFAEALTPINGLLAGGPQQSRHRMHVRGVVTYHYDNMLVIQDGPTGVSVFPVTKCDAKPGDGVEVAGFVRMGMYNPILEQALVRVSGPGGEPAPEEPELAKLKPRELAERDWRLISVVGTAGTPTRREERGFMLRADKYQVPVRLPADAPVPTLGSVVRVTGVCDLHPGRDVILLSTASTSFSLLTRTPADVVVLKEPSWWTRERLQVVVASAAAALLLALIWVVTLRRRVAQRSHQLVVEVQARRDAQVAYEATSTERKRLAGELHDSLEQGLTGVALQLDAAALGLPDPPPPLTMAKQLLAHCRAEVRRAVWDLNADAGDEPDLPARLRACAEQAVYGREAQVVVDVRGVVVPASGLIAHHLGRIVQEAAHNAVRHGQARTLTITLSFTAHLLELTIVDNGCGFDPTAAMGPDAGHFGVQGMRERARKLGGELALTSAVGVGTTITMQIPLIGAAS